MAPVALAGLTALLTSPVAIAIFFKATGLAAVADAFRVCLRVSTGKSVGIPGDDFVNGL